MPILKGDVKLVKSEVMDDVPEGGGGPTANVVVDGVSNAIFPDVSETDRAAGRVSARKVHVVVQSDDTDTYLGGNVIIARPPNDPNVAITLMTTNDVFDRRAAAISRIEAYLNVGTAYAGFLFGNLITGMAQLAIIQRTNELPAIGDTLALTKREGFSDQLVQYVRITEASAVLTTFTDGQGDYQRYVLTLKISDPLRGDFPGFDQSRIDPTKAQLAAATKVSKVIVADASKYYGVVKLDEAAAIGDFSVKAEGIYTQLVPSAQIETPIGDARANQLLAGVIGGGAAVVVSLTLAFTAAQSMYIGGAIRPGTLSIVNGGVTVTDSGGRLMSAGKQVGNVDYENGIVSLLSNVFGAGALTFVVTYQPASVPEAVTKSESFPVTIATRALSYARTIEPPPVAGTLSIAYMVARKWYVLRDDGSGALRGADSSYGSGQVNATTGTVLLTLGALPDVDSEVIFQWVEPKAAQEADVLVLDNNGKLYWPFNTSGASSLEPGDQAIAPGGLTISWVDGGSVTRTVTDNGAGLLTGYGTGTVDYAKGTGRLSPTALPPRGTQINIALAAIVKQQATVIVAAGSGNFGVTGITPGSVDMLLDGQLKGTYNGGVVVNWGGLSAYRVVDNGAGVLQAVLNDQRVNVGTVNYAAGTFSLNTSTTIPNSLAAQLTAWDNIFLYEAGFLASISLA